MFTFPEPESRLYFTFGDPWRLVMLWDKEPAYREGFQRLQNTSVVDFVGLRDERLSLIEVKNFTRHRIENKRRLNSGELAEEVSCKVRDTIAGLVWACDRGFCDASVQALLRSIFVSRSGCDVVLWLEEDLDPRPPERSALAGKIKERLRWLNPHVSVRSRRDPLLGMTVKGAPEGE